MADKIPLRYGENPHQKAWWTPGENIPQVVQEGKSLSSTNVLDLDAALRLVLGISTIAACVIKHLGPCGVATADSINDAFVAARGCDPLSAFGGIVGLNRSIDAAVARSITGVEVTEDKPFIECLIAPGVDDDARPILASKKNLRVLVADASIFPDIEYRSALGGMLEQERDKVEEVQEEWNEQRADLKVVTKVRPTQEQWNALRFAWNVCANVKSNAVVLTDATKTLGIGGGQPSRVASARIAQGRLKAGSALFSYFPNCVAASDAFFPHPDGLNSLIDAGVRAVAHPGGSVKDHEAIALADQCNIAMVHTGRRHFRH
ncbi:MAG TPA: hypothetical protein VF974_08540 [Patescibacteria group bacterium]